MQYAYLWAQLRGPMSTRLTILRDELESTPELAKHFHFVPVSYYCLASHSRATLLVKDARDPFGPVVLSVHFKLHDEPTGSNVSFHVQSGVLAPWSAWSYCPYNYSKSGLTTDLDDLLGRVEDMPFNMLRTAAQDFLLSLDMVPA